MAETDKLNDNELAAIIPFSGHTQALPAEQQLMASGKSLQRVQTAYTTAIAVQKARSITRIQNNVLEEAGLAAEKFYWGWNVQTKKGKRWIQGASIDLAMCIVRHYGNCALDVDVEESLTHFLFKGTFVDLESGFTCPRLFRQRKNQNIGGKMNEDADRKEDVVFQIGQSKALRNAVVNAMPNWLIDQAIEKAKQAAKKGIEDLPASRARALKYFMDKGANQERIEAAMEKSADQWSADDILELNAMRVALNESRVTIDELFPKLETKETEPSAGTSKEPPTDNSKGQEPPKEGKPTLPYPQKWGEAFTKVTGIEHGTFWRLKTTGMKQFMDHNARIEVVRDWPEDVIKLVTEKAKMIGKTNPDFWTDWQVVLTALQSAKENPVPLNSEPPKDESQPLSGPQSSQQQQQQKEEPEIEPPIIDAKADSQGRGSLNPSWNQLWWFCPDMGSEPNKDGQWKEAKQGVPLMRCVKCEKRKDCPNPAPKPKDDDIL